MVEERDILKLVRSQRYRPMRAEELAAALDVPKEGHEEFGRLLRNLELAGEIVQVKQKQFACPSKLNLMVGKLEVNRSGFGFVRPLKPGREDVYVSEEDMGSAMHDDIVAVRLPSAHAGFGRGRRGRKALRASGYIVNVVQRANATVVGRFAKRRHVGYVAPDNPKLFRDIYVADEDTQGARPGDKVIVKIVEWPSRHLNAEGVVTEILGPDGAPGVDIESVAHAFNLPHDFPEAALAEAQAIPPQVPESALQGRRDLRNDIIITIDPEDAKDHDDAISLAKDADGHWLLGVHIADVSHYVRPGSTLDKEARKRGTSVYFPGTVIPMLPEALSNGICSLHEGVDRLTKSAFMTFSADGKLLKRELCHSVIRVIQRLNYKQATRSLRRDPSAGVKPEAHALLVRAAELARVLYDKRMERGALDLNLPEVKLKLDEGGNVVGAEKVERDISHRLIEEFMLSANEAVARFLIEKQMPYLCRAHEEPDPDDLEEFAVFVAPFGYRNLKPINRHKLQKVVEQAKGKAEEHAVNLMLLMSLRQAEYSADLKPHYALALDHYTHFTSPIRRYPDLLAHRLLDQHFSGELHDRTVRDTWLRSLPEWAEHCSVTERRAGEAEHEVTNVKLLRFLEAHVGKEMDAVITGVQEYGFFVQLTDYLLEGLVHIRTLIDDFYRLDKRNAALVGDRRGRTFKLGSKVKVRLHRIDMLKKQADFVVVGRA
ncbi:MAG: ribonuclease R [Planctomycetes bacterium]|nr:ribonuclease R [Planctomycetota bacterium]